MVGHSGWQAGTITRSAPSPATSPAEILSTLLAAKRDLELPDGHWPSQWEYSESTAKVTSSKFKNFSVAIPANQVTQAFDPFTADELWVLRRFTRKVDELKDSAFAQSETTLKGVMIPGAETLGGPAFQIGVEGPSEEQVKAVIGDFRQLYTDTNKASASRVMNILKASAKRQGNAISTEVIDALRSLKTRIKRRKAHDPRGVFLEETAFGESVERTPENIISIWLNGEYLHGDVGLAELIDPPGHMSNEMMRMSLQMAIRDFIAYWTAIQELVDVALDDPRLITASP